MFHLPRRRASQYPTQSRYPIRRRRTDLCRLPSRVGPVGLVSRLDLKAALNALIPVLPLTEKPSTVSAVWRDLRSGTGH